MKLEVFSPRLRLEKLTKRGLVRTTEPLFPCYIFIRCVIEEHFNEIQHTSGVNRLVHFGGRIPVVPDLIIEELQQYFEADETLTVDGHLSPGDEVTVASGAFAGLSAYVLKSLPAKKRVQILLDILGRPTLVEVEQDAVIPSKNNLADLAPILAVADHRRNLTA